MLAFVKSAKSDLGCINAAAFVDELKKLAKPEQADTTRRDDVLKNFDDAKKALKKAADDFEASTASLYSIPRNQFFQGACDATSKLIDALQAQVDAIDGLPTKPPTPPTSMRSGHTQRMRDELATQINALQEHLNTALASAAPDQLISFQEVWTCLEVGHQKLAKLEGYTATVVPTITTALPAALRKATTFQLGLQKQMADLLAKHHSDGSEVVISPKVAQALTKDIDQLKIVVTDQGEAASKQAKALLGVADQIRLRLNLTSLPTYAVLFEWSKSIATMPGYVGGKTVAPAVTPLTQGQREQRERFFGLMRSIFIRSYGPANQGAAQGCGVGVDDETVKALEVELKKAVQRCDMPPGLRTCVDKMETVLKGAGASPSRMLTANDIKDLYEQMRDLQGFPSVKLGETYSEELAVLIRDQIAELKRSDLAYRLNDPKNNGSAPANGNEDQIWRCLRNLNDGWVKAAAANQIKYDDIDKKMNALITSLAGKLSSQPTPKFTIGDAIQMLEESVT